MANSETVERDFPTNDDKADPPYLHPDYGSTVKRAPSRAPIPLEHTVTERSEIAFAPVEAGENDLTAHGDAQPIGERIDVRGRVLDEDAHR